jgi:hypothetical protein
MCSSHGHHPTCKHLSAKTNTSSSGLAFVFGILLRQGASGPNKIQNLLKKVERISLSISCCYVVWKTNMEAKKSFQVKVSGFKHQNSIGIAGYAAGPYSYSAIVIASFIAQ